MKTNNSATPIKITIEGGATEGKTLQLTMHPHSTLEEWIDTFKTILVHQTFTCDCIKELFDETVCMSCNDLVDDQQPTQFLREKSEF